MGLNVVGGFMGLSLSVAEAHFGPRSPLMVPCSLCSLGFGARCC